MGTLNAVYAMLCLINLGILACFVGLLFTVPFTGLMLAVTYLSMTGQPLGGAKPCNPGTKCPSNSLRTTGTTEPTAQPPGLAGLFTDSPAGSGFAAAAFSRNATTSALSQSFAPTTTATMRPPGVMM